MFLNADASLGWDLEWNKVYLTFHKTDGLLFPSILDIWHSSTDPAPNTF